MTNYERKVATIILCLLGIFILFAIGYHISPSIRSEFNLVAYDVQKADDATRYETRKQVEDTCRAMMASYESDRLTYLQYKDAEEPKNEWAEQAKMRANKTAATYNNYILENSFVWEDNIPNDIDNTLPYIE